MIWGADDFILSCSWDPLPGCGVPMQSTVLVGHCQIYVWSSERS